MLSGRDENVVVRNICSAQLCSGYQGCRMADEFWEEQFCRSKMNELGVQSVALQCLHTPSLAIQNSIAPR